MMRLIRWAPLVLYGISASTALAEADISTSPARSDAPLFAASVPLGPDLDTTATSHGLYRPEKRQASTPGSLELTPAHLAELLSELQIVYAQLSIVAETRDTGLLNNLLGVLSGVVPPLSDVIEGVRSILIGDSVTILQQLAAAQALGTNPCIPRSTRFLLMRMQVYVLSRRRKPRLSQFKAMRMEAPRLSLSLGRV